MPDIEGAKDESLIEANFGRTMVLQCIPASITAQLGYTAPFKDAEDNPINGGRGTPWVGGDVYKFGADTSWSRNTDTNVFTPKPPRFDRIIDPEEINEEYPDNSAGNDPPLLSNVKDIFREWYDKSTYKTVISTVTGRVRVNGVDKGTPSGDVLWACHMERTEDETVLKVLLAVTCAYPDLKFYTKNAGASADAAWTLRATQSIAALNAASNPAQWLRKCDRNQSGTIASCFLRNPWWDDFQATDNVRHSKWAWIVDFDVNTYGLTVEEMPVEDIVRNRVVEGTFETHHPFTNALLTTGNEWGYEEFSATGSRHIDFDYVGNDKVYTSLVFTGTSHVDFNKGAFTPQTEGDFPIRQPEPPTSGEVTNDREIHIQKGEVDVLLWKDNRDYQSEDGADVSVSEYVFKGYLLWYGFGQWVLLSVERTGNLSDEDVTYTTDLILYKEGEPYPLLEQRVYDAGAFGSVASPQFMMTGVSYSGPATGRAEKNGVGGTEYDEDAQPYLPLGHSLSISYYAAIPGPFDTDFSPWNFRFVSDNFYLMSNAKMSVVYQPEVDPDAPLIYDPNTSAYYAFAGIVMVEADKFVHSSSHPAVLTALFITTESDAAKNIRLV